MTYERYTTGITLCTLVNYDSKVEIQAIFSRYDSRVAIYERKILIRLAKGTLHPLLCPIQKIVRCFNKENTDILMRSSLYASSKEGIYLHYSS